MTLEPVPIELQPADAELLRHCFYQGMEAKYMELVKWTPEAKQYRDNVSKKISGIFKIRPELTDKDEPIDPKFYQTETGYIGGANRFSIVVEGKQVVVTCESEKTRWHTKGQTLDWQPQVFRNGVEVTCLAKPTQSSQYDTHLNNVLEWDYGICKRRLRIIEGAFFEVYVFAADPKGDIEIRSNASGDLVPEAYWAMDAEGVPLKMQTELGIKRIAASEFVGKAYPVEVDDSGTFYSTASDGYIYVTGDTWANLRSAGTGTATDNTAASYANAVWAYSYAATRYIARSFFYFDTSSIGAGSSVTVVTGSLYGITYAESDVCMQEGTQADPLTTADFDSFTGAPNGSMLHDSGVGWATGQYNDFAFNATGLAAIVKDGTTKIVTREYTHEYLNSEPSSTWYRNGCYYTDSGLVDSTMVDPKLAVTWEAVGWTGKISGVTNPAKIMGVAVANISKVKGVP